MGGEDKTHDELANAMEAARVGYLTFRTIGRGAFPETADQMSLGLVGRLREDFRVFVTRAQSSYENAAKEPFTAKMTERGYSPARLKTLSDELDGLIKRFSAASTAQGAAMKSTEERDEAYRSLREFMKEFKAVCRGVFRGEPATLKKLKL